MNQLTPAVPARGVTNLVSLLNPDWNVTAGCKVATLSAVVAKVNPQRSVEIRLLDKEGWQPAGNVTIPANQKVPVVGAVVEIRYLYAFRESGCLYQPTYLGVRQDIEEHECIASQLKFKSSDEDDS